MDQIKRNLYELLFSCKGNWRMALSRCAPLSTAELVRCAERDISAAVGSQQTLALLYGDQETTSDNIVSEMRTAAACQSVTAAVANLYLRKQVIFERACA